MSVEEIRNLRAALRIDEGSKWDSGYVESEFWKNIEDILGDMGFVEDAWGGGVRSWTNGDVMVALGSEFYPFVGEQIVDRVLVRGPLGEKAIPYPVLEGPWTTKEYYEHLMGIANIVQREAAIALGRFEMGESVELDEAMNVNKVGQWRIEWPLPRQGDGVAVAHHPEHGSLVVTTYAQDGKVYYLDAEGGSRGYRSLILLKNAAMPYIMRKLAEKFGIDTVNEDVELDEASWDANKGALSGSQLAVYEGLSGAARRLFNDLSTTKGYSGGAATTAAKTELSKAKLALVKWSAAGDRDIVFLTKKGKSIARKLFDKKYTEDVELDEGRKYYVLVGKSSKGSRWEVVFGDYDKENVSDEKDSEGENWKSLRIISLGTDKQSAINAAIKKLNEDVKLDEAKLTKEDLKRPWTLNATQWLIIKGVHQPWIAEISPFQYSRMSDRQKAAYDKKRAAEWDASARAKQEWAKAVYDAYRAKKFDLKGKDVHPDARFAAVRGEIESEKAQQKALFDKAREENFIRDTSELKVGDRVFSIMSRNYVDILKVSKKSVQISTSRGGKMKQDPRTLQWLSHDDLKKKVLGEDVSLDEIRPGPHWDPWPTKKITTKELIQSLEQSAKIAAKYYTQQMADVTASIAWAMKKGDKEKVRRIIEKHGEHVVGGQGTVNQIMHWMEGWLEDVNFERKAGESMALLNEAQTRDVVAVLLRKAKFYDGDMEKTALSVAKALLSVPGLRTDYFHFSRTSTRLYRSEFDTLRTLLTAVLDKWLIKIDGHDAFDFKAFVEEVSSLLTPTWVSRARSDAKKSMGVGEDVSRASSIMEMRDELVGGELHEASGSSLKKGSRVKTPLGDGTVAYMRMGPPDYNTPVSVSVVLDKKRLKPGYTGTMFLAKDVKQLNEDVELDEAKIERAHYPKEFSVKGTGDLKGLEISGKAVKQVYQAVRYEITIKSLLTKEVLATGETLRDIIHHSTGFNFKTGGEGAPAGIEGDIKALIKKTLDADSSRWEDVELDEEISQYEIKRGEVQGEGRYMLPDSGISKHGLKHSDLIGWFANKYNMAVGWYIFEASPRDKSEFGANAVRTYSEKTDAMSVAKFDLKNGTYAFLDNKAYEDGVIKYEKSSAYNRISVINSPKAFKAFGISHMGEDVELDEAKTIKGGATSFDDPKVKDEIDMLSKHVGKMKEWLDRNTKGGSWKAGYVGPIQSIDFPGTYGASVQFSRKDQGYAGGEWWTIDVKSPVGLDNVVVTAKGPGDRGSRRVDLGMVKKQDLGNPEKVFRNVPLPFVKSRKNEDVELDETTRQIRGLDPEKAFAAIRRVFLQGGFVLLDRNKEFSIYRNDGRMGGGYISVMNLGALDRANYGEIHVIAGVPASYKNQNAVKSMYDTKGKENLATLRLATRALSAFFDVLIRPRVTELYPKYKRSGAPFSDYLAQEDVELDESFGGWSEDGDILGALRRVGIDNIFLRAPSSRSPIGKLKQAPGGKKMVYVYPGGSMGPGKQPIARYWVDDEDKKLLSGEILKGKIVYDFSMPDMSKSTLKVDKKFSGKTAEEFARLIKSRGTQTEDVELDEARSVKAMLNGLYVTISEMETDPDYRQKKPVKVEPYIGNLDAHVREMGQIARMNSDAHSMVSAIAKLSTKLKKWANDFDASGRVPSNRLGEIISKLKIELKGLESLARRGLIEARDVNLGTVREMRDELIGCCQ